MTAILERMWPHILVVLAVGGFLLWVDHRGYERAKADMAAQAARDAAMINEAVDKIDLRTATRLSSIRATDRTIIQPMLTKEIASAPRYADPACALTPSVRDALNQARALTGATSADSGTMPTPAPNH